MENQNRFEGMPAARSTYQWWMRQERFYPITALHKDDLRDLFRNPTTGKLPNKLSRRIDALSDAEMQHIASKLADAFCNCCYWTALREIFLQYSSAGDYTLASPAAGASRRRRWRTRNQEVRRWEESV